MGEHVNPRRMLKYIGDRSSRLTREGRSITRTKPPTEPVEMINWRAVDLMKYSGATVDPISESDIEAAWSAEIERRLVEIDAGTVELIPWEDIRLELFRESEWRE